MQVAYPGAFVGDVRRSARLRDAPPSSLAIAGAIVFAVAKALKWWAILTLGRFWTFRVIVVPGATLVSRGPYRFLRHPNYVGVIGELVGVGLLTGAVVSGPIATRVVRRVDSASRRGGRTCARESGWLEVDRSV